MCGILGVLKRDGNPIDRSLLLRMRDSMFHRGPDDGGIYVNGPVGLGHRRLSVVDLSPDGHQPMCNEDGSVWLVFNGEIYNYVELAARLRQRGHVFRSRTDSEVIIHLYEDMGDRCVNELNGMFSFILWDSRRGQFFGARDRMGIKPFYYYTDSKQFVCASEIKAILEDPSVPRAPDRRGVADYLFAGAPLAGKTFFEGICELPPGHTITVRGAENHVRSYWDVCYRYDESRSSEELTHQIAELLDDSVRIHCRSDAAVGAHLSGGIDSSTVTSLAVKHVQPLKSFSIRFAGGELYDETPFARLVSRAVGTDYQERTETPQALEHLFASLIWHMDQPPAGGGDGGFSYYAAASLASEHVKVALTGHGGDEVFAGYPAQLQMAGAGPSAFERRAPESVAPGAGARLRRMLGREGLRGVVRRVASRLSPSQPITAEDLWMQLHCGLPPSSNPLLHHSFRRSLGGYSPVTEYLKPFRNAPSERMLDRCLYHDLRVYLPQLLHKEDRASMAVSIESRVPLLDYRIVELMATVPPSQKISGNVPKALLRNAAAPWLPPEIFHRRDKVPFTVPIKDWLGGVLAPLAKEIASSPACLERGIFSPDIIRRGLLDESELLSLLNIELWFRIYIDRDPWSLAQTSRASRAAAGGLANERLATIAPSPVA